MIRDLVVRELESRLEESGLAVQVWGGEEVPELPFSSTLHAVFPGTVEAWVSRSVARERVACLAGMLKLVLCDRREGSPTEGEVQEIFLGEYRYREVLIPPGVLRGWKAVGDRPALVLSTLEGEGGDAMVIPKEDAAVLYDWDIVMQ